MSVSTCEFSKPFCCLLSENPSPASTELRASIFLALPLHRLGIFHVRNELTLWIDLENPTQALIQDVATCSVIVNHMLEMVLKMQMKEFCGLRKVIFVERKLRKLPLLHEQNIYVIVCIMRYGRGGWRHWSTQYDRQGQFIRCKYENEN